MSNIKHIIIEELQNFIDEDINKGSFIVWHYTHNNPESEEFSLKNELFKPGGGDFYGRGLYASYTWENLEEYNMSKYGRYLIEFKVDNTGKFIIMDYDEAKRIYGNEKYDLISQMKRVLGGEFYEIYKSYKNEFDKYNEELKVTHRSAPILKKIYKYLILNVDGFFYSGGHDGRACVIYNLGTIHPLRFSEDHGKTWKNLPSKNYYNKLKSYDDFNQKLNQIKHGHVDNKFYNDKQIFKRLLQNEYGTTVLSKDQINNLPNDETRVKYLNYFIFNDEILKIAYKFMFGVNEDVALGFNFSGDAIFFDLKGNINTKDVINKITIDDFNHKIYNINQRVALDFIKLKFNITPHKTDKFIYGVNKDISVVDINIYTSIPVSFDKGNIINQISIDDLNTFKPRSRAQILNAKLKNDIFNRVSEFKYGSNKNLAYALKSDNKFNFIFIDVNGIETIKGIGKNDLNDIPTFHSKADIFNKIHPNANISNLSDFIYGNGKYALAIYNGKYIFITFDNKKYNPDYSIISKNEFNNSEHLFRNVIFFKGEYNRSIYVSKTVFKNNTVFFVDTNDDKITLYKWGDNSKFSNIEKFNDYLDYDDFMYLESKKNDLFYKNKKVSTFLKNLLIYNNVNIVDDDKIFDILFLNEFSGKNPDDFYFLIKTPTPYIVNYKNKKISPNDIKPSLLYERYKKDRLDGGKIIVGYFNGRFNNNVYDGVIEAGNEYVYLLSHKRQYDIIKDVFDDSTNKNKHFLKYLKKSDLPNLTYNFRTVYFQLILDIDNLLIYHLSPFEYLNNTALFLEGAVNNKIFKGIFDYLGNKIKTPLPDEDIAKFSYETIVTYFLQIYNKRIYHTTYFFKLNNGEYRAIVSFDENTSNLRIINTKAEDVSDKEKLENVFGDIDIPNDFKIKFANIIYKTNIFEEIYDDAWNKNDIILVKTKYTYLDTFHSFLFFNYKTNKFTVKGVNCDTLIDDAEQYLNNDVDIYLEDYLSAYFYTKYIKIAKMINYVNPTDKKGIFKISFNTQKIKQRDLSIIENIKYVKCNGDLFDYKYMYVNNLENLNFT